MAPFLTLLTHLCVHLLGLMGNSFVTLIISVIGLLTYGLYFVLLPALWPGRILHDTLKRIEGMEICLHEEAKLRRLFVGRLKRIRNKLADDHGAHLDTPLLYRRVALSLCKRVRRCKRDVEVLCQELDIAMLRQIQRLNNPDATGDSETVSRGRTWFDAALTALID
ncbi:hypothetical protein C8R44DRAFT_736166 [Mycena epipterygia]|nr:hypothetical protein C8R44DRAFT_736166 [Mycena epipterygia]